MSDRPGVSRRSFAGGAAAAGLVGALAPQSGMALAGKPEIETIAELGVMIPMRDGVRMATDIYRPARDGRALPGRFPVIFERTPYGRNRPYFRDYIVKDARRRSRAEVAAYFVSHGYVVVLQDVRGRHDSEGEFVKYLSDPADGFDSCQWIVGQDWSNGSIGMTGTSYASHTQTAAASVNAPGLKALFLDCGGFSNAFQGGIRQGGAFELKQVTWAYAFGKGSLDPEKDRLRLAALDKVNLKEQFQQTPWKRGHTPLSLLPDYEDYVYDQWEHGSFDSFWKQPGLYAAGYYPQIAQAATIHMSGWYDAYPRTATENYVGLKKLGRGNTQLVLGPWTHGAKTVSRSGDVEFGPAATLDGNLASDYFAMRLAYFDRHLKGMASLASAEPPVRIFVMGGGSGRKNADGRLEHGGRWRAESDWPLPDARRVPYYLYASGGLGTDLPTGAKDSLSYNFDPTSPVPTIGGTVTSGEPLMRPGGFDQRESADVYGAREPFLPLAMRPDVLSFQTGILTEDVEVTGEIEAELWISSDCPDTDFTIKLIDLYPPSADYPEGYALNLTDGIMRCRYRDSWSKPKLMKAGKAYRIRVAAFPTSNLFKRGHRIRLDVSSSNFPHFDVNPNTGAAEGKGLTSRIATNTVYLNPKRASHVILPIIPHRPSHLG